MRAFKAKKFIDNYRGIVPSDAAWIREALNRCENTLANGRGLCCAEKAFLRLLKQYQPSFENDLEIFLEDVSDYHNRQMSDCEKIFWRKFPHNSEFLREWSLIIEPNKG